MSEKISPPKKMVSRNVAIALGIICIILVAGLGVVLLIAYSPTSGSLQTTYNDYVNDHHHTDEDYNTTSSQNANLNNIINLIDSTVWVSNEPINQGAGAYSTWTFSASYPGYVSVLVQTSTVAGTHVEVIYSSYGVNFNQEITVSAGNSAVFPLLPSSSVTVGVGNGNILSSASETVTITYYY